MRFNTPRRRASRLNLNVIASIMMALAGFAAVVFVAVIAYVLISEGRSAPTSAGASTKVQVGDQPTPTWTPDPLTQRRAHVVALGETLTGIAAAYNVPLKALEQINRLTDPSSITPGQTIIIPAPIDLTPTVPAVVASPTVTPTLVPDDPAYLALTSGWPRSLAGGYTDDELNGNYPRLLERPRFRLHYQPGTYPDHNLDALVALIEAALTNVETRMNAHLGGSFDIYAAGTLFAADDINLRGFSQSRDRKVFVLIDGSGDDAERAYVITHELSHLVSWQSWGTPSSTMLSEGVATYVGKPELELNGYVPYDQLCLAIYAADQMQSMAAIDRDFKAFQGHIENRFNYFGAACFVEYLVQHYGLDMVRKVYHTSDYGSLTGKSLAQLNDEWQATLKARQGELRLDPAKLVSADREVNMAYDFIFSNYDGSVGLHEAYLDTDRARIALWRGDMATMRHWLDAMYALTGYHP